MTMHITKYVKRENRKTQETFDNHFLVKLTARLKFLKYLALAMLICMPFIMTPTWCVEKRLASQQCLPEVYPNSTLWQMPPIYGGVLNMLCYLILSFFIVVRLFVKKRTKSSIARTVFLITMMLVGVADFAYHAINGKSDQDVIVFVNILFLLAFIRNLREVWIQIAKVVLGSLSMFIIVFCFLLLFSLLGYALFSNNKLDDSFADPFSSLYSVFGMFTEANYPDI